MSVQKLSLVNPYVLLTCTALLWAGNAIAGKLAVDHVSPFMLTSGRWFIACLILIPIALPHLKRDQAIIRKHFWFLVLCSALGFTIFNNLLYLALTHTTAINAAIEQASMPLVVFVLNYLLYKTKATFFQIFGFALTLIGILITASRGDVVAFFSGNFNIGDMLMIVAIAFYGSYSVILRNKPNMHLISFMTCLAMSAFVISLPFTLYEISAERFIFPTDIQGLGVVLYAGIFPSIVAQFFWVIGLEKIGSNRGGIFINLVPVFGAILAMLILGEIFELYHAVGGVLVLGGILLAQKMSAKEKAQNA